MKLIDNWKSVLFRSAAIRASVASLALPEIVQTISNHTEYIPGITDDTKRLIQAACVVASVVLRLIKQPSLSQPVTREGA